MTKEGQGQESIKGENTESEKEEMARQEVEDKHHRKKNTITNDPLPVQRWEKSQRLHHYGKMLSLKKKEKKKKHLLFFGPQCLL